MATAAPRETFRGASRATGNARLRSRGSKMYKDASIGIGAGLVSALMWASIASAVPGGLIFAYLAPLPLMAAGLGIGARATAFGAIAGTAVAGFAGSLFFGLLFSCAVALPAYMVTRQALLSRNGPGGIPEWFSPGDILARLAAIGAALIAAAGVIHFDVQGGLAGAVQSYIDPLLQTRFGLVADEARARMIAHLLPWLPAMVASSWILQLAVNAVVAQAILKRAKRNLRPTPSYAALGLPDWLYWALVGSAALALAGSGNVEYVARNMVMVLGVPFFFLGLGVIHVAVRRLTAPGVALILFYVVLFFFGWTAVAVAGLGFFEPWADLRRRLAGPAGPPPIDDE